jgi:LPXTG-site transpeptidase (sortase) family protein
MKPLTAHYQVVVFLLGVVALGGALGGISGLSGTEPVDQAGALFGINIDQSTKLIQSAQRRRVRREARLKDAKRVVSDIGTTYPMQASTLLTQNLSERFEVTLNTGFLSYPSLGIAAPIGRPSLTHWKSRNWRGLEDQMQFGLLHGVVAYPHSPEWGGAGNIILAGHSAAPTLEARMSPYQAVLASLPDAKMGDRIELRNGMGEVTIYEVFDARVIPATETSILLQDTSTNELTIFTCYPVGTTKERFAVRARLVSEKNVAAR